jgi:capsular polysaccharide biosynthesis protein
MEGTETVMNELDELTISLKDMFCRILLRWRLMIAGMLIGAVVLGGVGYLKNAGAATKNTESTEADVEKVVEKYEAELSEADQQVVKAAYNAYTAYQKSCKFIEKYNENSVKMKLNANQLPTLRLQYLVNTHYEAIYPVVEAKDLTLDIINSYVMKIKNRDVYEKIAGTLTDETDAAYIEELISVERQEDLFWVTVHGMSEKDCQAMIDIIKKTIDQETVGLKKMYGEYDIILADESYSEYANSALLTDQRQQMVDYNNQVVAMNNLSVNMTEEQKGYYEALLKAEVEAGGTVEQNSGAKKREEAFSGSLLNKKYILVGAFAGIFLVCCYAVCQYLLSARLRVKEDLEECFGITNLGVLPASRPRRKVLDILDRWIISKFGGNNGQFSEKERLRMICAGIGIAAKKSGMQSVYLTGVCNDECCEQVKTILLEKVRGTVEEVRCGKSVVYDPESLETLVMADGVVLVERINGSRYDELKKEVEICRQNQIKIIGSVIVSGS